MARAEPRSPRGAGAGAPLGLRLGPPAASGRRSRSLFLSSPPTAGAHRARPRTPGNRPSGPGLRGACPPRTICSSAGAGADSASSSAPSYCVRRWEAEHNFHLVYPNCRRKLHRGRSRLPFSARSHRVPRPSALFDMGGSGEYRLAPIRHLSLRVSPDSLGARGQELVSQLGRRVSVAYWKVAIRCSAFSEGGWADDSG